ncbi:MAG TPA: SRPBCC domain-containing protein [Ramlibacter sp.]|uniref:SRPBCC domain-containing protein n=1 Tax=Ramlibacter sp. TaxID=1917967 RepID=UPI002CD59E4A|nr:SRPBCC domain-containing protein [Ramlibacter sp.]HVZ43802.1 SRPBCC domain-containing protein [Ramlibacter sp.]
MNTSSPTTIPPVDHCVNVPLSVEDAFDLFTKRLALWWPLSTHSCAQGDAVDVEFEPRVGGRVLEHDKKGARHVWGTLLEWNPPHVLAMTWHPGQAEDQATRLKVSFTAKGASTDVRILHDGWEARGAEGGEWRGEYEKGWAAVMQRYVDAAANR